ncbi:hypothetical protein LL912_00320 [Niabella sp. CC-SYL272]|uniref:hypothetical protein n=1 Tax=Niabella agricola TaxID=2891571 RepID=UPI001F3AC6F8|nr:hypothetical protein [Niabella agricola]MCF3107212.1 hypothetical protein [Niabella agricola]
MKHKILFMLPRLAGLTLLIGLASLVLFLLFKLMLLAIGISLIALIAGKIIKKTRQKWAEGNGLEWSANPYLKELHHNSTLQPIAGKKSQGTPAIIPIH